MKDEWRLNAKANERKLSSKLEEKTNRCTETLTELLLRQDLSVTGREFKRVSVDRGGIMGKIKRTSSPGLLEKKILVTD